MTLWLKSAICILSLLASGRPVPPAPLLRACQVVQAAVADSTPSWHAEINDACWQVSEAATVDGPCHVLTRSWADGVEVLALPAGADSVFVLLSEGHEWLRDWGWAYYRVRRARVCDDARRRVLARELYGVLDWRCE